MNEYVYNKKIYTIFMFINVYITMFDIIRRMIILKHISSFFTVGTMGQLPSQLWATWALSRQLTGFHNNPSSYEPATRGGPSKKSPP